MGLKEVKTPVAGLSLGMFVARLDRPWVDTPFEFQGFRITDAKDIERLRRYCNYVYVDVEQGPAPPHQYWIFTQEPSSKANHPKPSGLKGASIGSPTSGEIAGLRKRQYLDQSDVSEEMRQAESTYGELSLSVTQLLSDLSRGRHADLKKLKKGVSDMVDSIVRNPAALMWVRELRKVDDYSYSRALGSSVWCAIFGRHLGVTEHDIKTLSLGGVLLDVGKTGLPPKLLRKSGVLTPEEIALMKTHVELGVKILSSANGERNTEIPHVVLQMVACHHERFNGGGYPQGLASDEIPLYARIAGIADSYDAMTTSRPFSSTPPRSPHEAITELHDHRDLLFQGELVEQFIQAIGIYPTGSLVELSTGEVGAVVAVHGLRRLRPSVMLLLDENKEPMPQFQILDLSLLDENISVRRGLPAGAHGINMQELFL